MRQQKIHPAPLMEPNGSIYKRTYPSGATAWTAHVAWYEGSRRRQSKKTYATKREAQAALSEMLVAHRTQTFLEPSRLTVAAYAMHWLALAEAAGRKRSTLQGYRDIIERHVIARLGAIAVQDLKVTELNRMYADLLAGRATTGGALSMTTVHHIHTVIGTMLNEAEREGVVVRNVARHATAPSLSRARAEGPEMRVWAPEDLAAFLRSIEGNRNETLFRVMALTGVRRSEVVGLRWSDVDFSHRTATIRRAVTVHGQEETVHSPKSKRSRRVISLDDETVRILRSHREQQKGWLASLGIKAPTDDRVFVNDMGEPMRPDSIGQAFRRLVQAAGVPTIRLHDLRHTHATHLLRAGVNVKVVSERLGHSSVSFTLDTYGHVLPGQQAEAAAAAASLIA